MGFLGSVLVAMVTSVSCGHSGRVLAADDLVWGLFWGLRYGRWYGRPRVDGRPG